MFWGASIETLLNNIKQFLQNFSLRRIKLGAVVDFLDDLELHETRDKFATLLKTIKVKMNNECLIKQCSKS